MFYEITHALSKRNSSEQLIAVCNGLLNDGVSLPDLIGALSECLTLFINDVYLNEINKAYCHFNLIKTSKNK